MATDESSGADKRLEVLHDHYKETFARQREMEAVRDRLFLWVIGLFALLSLEIGYPAAIGASLGKIGVAGAEINLQALPLPALLNATWVLTLAIALRYCRAAIHIDRQYDYIHMLERNISPILRDSQRKAGETVPPPLLDEDIYQREGTVYLRGYPLLLNVAWIAYVIIFPIILLVATSSLVAWEWRRLPYPILNRAFDTGIAVALIAFLLLYRVLPYTIERWGGKGKQKHQESEQTAV